MISVRRFVGHVERFHRVVGPDHRDWSLFVLEETVSHAMGVFTAAQFEPTQADDRRFVEGLAIHGWSIRTSSCGRGFGV